MQIRRALIRERNDVVMESLELDHEEPRAGARRLMQRALAEHRDGRR